MKRKWKTEHPKSAAPFLLERTIWGVGKQKPPGLKMAFLLGLQGPFKVDSYQQMANQNARTECISAGNLYIFIRRIFLLIFSKFGDTTRRGRSCVLARCGRRVLWLREKALTVKQGRVTSRLFFLSWYETGYELQKIHNKTIDNRPTPPKEKKTQHKPTGTDTGGGCFEKIQNSPPHPSGISCKPKEYTT